MPARKLMQMRACMSMLVQAQACRHELVRVRTSARARAFVRVRVRVSSCSGSGSYMPSRADNYADAAKGWDDRAWSKEPSTLESSERPRARVEVAGRSGQARSQVLGITRELDSDTVLPTIMAPARPEQRGARAADRLMRWSTDAEWKDAQGRTLREVGAAALEG